MTSVERWMLPDGIEEILPPESYHVEYLRRHLLDLFCLWGYEPVTPPMMEFTNSLLVGSGADVDLLTYKVADHISGKTLGIRADITPQIARIDAHSLKREGVSRFCYTGHVLKTRTKTPLESRNPLSVGVELFGWPGLDADSEILSLLLSTIDLAKVPKACLDLGHVGIFRSLSEEVCLSPVDEEKLFDLLQSKALTEINDWVEANISDPVHARWLLALPRLSGSLDVLEQAREVFAGGPGEVFAALDELDAVGKVVTARFPESQLYFDLCELTGYNYLTGLAFAAFSPGYGTAVARGGRYDHIGEKFGRARSAIGFTMDLVAISRLSEGKNYLPKSGIFAAVSEDPSQWEAIQDLRLQGERVVVGAAKQKAPQEHQNCDRLLKFADGRYIVDSI